MEKEELKNLSDLCTALKDKRSEIEMLENLLKQSKEEERILSEEQIPLLLDEIGLESVSLSSGEKITIKNDLFVKIPEENKEACFDWLTKTGNEAIIKADVSCSFGKGEFEEAEKVFLKLFEKYPQSSIKKGVHPSTLKAFLKRRQENESDVPFELFGAHFVRKTEIKQK